MRGRIGMSGKLDRAAATAAREGVADQVVAIIGWGTAGVNAAIALRAAGFAGTIRAFSDTDIPPYSPILTSYYAGGEKTYDECFPWSAEELAELDVEVVPDGRVALLDPGAHRIVTERGVAPIDLVKYLFENNLVPDARLPFEKGEERSLLHENWDFLARLYLQTHYRGD